MASFRDLTGFMDEVRLLSLCNHPHVVSLRAASVVGTLTRASGTKRNVAYHVTDYARFGELYKLVKKTGPLPEQVARAYFRQLLAGLEYLHSAGIVHRDIKTENLLLDDELNLVIADFGSAARSRTGENKPVDFDSALPVGSQLCNAPEINMEKSYQGEKADIFSAGVCLFLMVTGCPPFGEASSRDAYFRLLLRKNKTAYWNIYKSLELSPEFRSLFEHMTEADPARRIDLQGILSHPWMLAGPTPTSEEIRGLLRDRLSAYLEMRMKKLANPRRKDKRGKQEECADATATIKGSPAYSECVAECAEINSRLSAAASLREAARGKAEERKEDQYEKMQDDDGPLNGHP